MLGFVKDDSESNEVYLGDYSADDPWYPIVRTAHERLLQLDPDYSIVQIKEKFGGLRYYYDSELAMAIPELREQMDQVIEEAEAEVARLERARRA